MGFLNTLSGVSGTTAPSAPSSGGFLKSLSYGTPTTSSPSVSQPTVSTPSPFQSGIPKPANTGFTSPTANILDTGNAAMEKIMPVTSKSFNPQDWLQAGADSWTQTMISAAKGVLDSVSTFQDQHATALDKGISVGEAGMGVLNGLFSPITTTLASVQKIPGIGYLADGMNNVFNLLGQGGTTVAQTALNKLPIPDTAKAKLNPLVGQIGALAAQLIAGKAGTDVIPDIAQKSHDVAQTLTEIAKDPNALDLLQQHDATQNPSTIAPQVKGGFLDTVQKPSHADYAKSQGYEPITPTEKLPTIQMGPKPTSELPTIQASAPKAPELPGYTVEPVKTPSVAPETAPGAIETPKTRTTQTLKPIEGTGELKTRGLSQNVEASAIEKKLTDNFGDLPEYKTLSLKDQAQKAADLISSKPEDARAIAMGEKAPPKGLLPESVYVAAEHQATIEGDVQTLKDLANSKLAASATTMGQRIRTLGERDQASPIAAIQEVQKAREADLAKRGASIQTDATARIRDSIRKTNTVKSWSNFVASINC